LAAAYAGLFVRSNGHGHSTQDTARFFLGAGRRGKRHSPWQHANSPMRIVRGRNCAWRLWTSPALAPIASKRWRSRRRSRGARLVRRRQIAAFRQDAASDRAMNKAIELDPLNVYAWPMRDCFSPRAATTAARAHALERALAITPSSDAFTSGWGNSTLLKEAYDALAEFQKLWRRRRRRMGDAMIEHANGSWRNSRIRPLKDRWSRNTPRLGP